jgi:VanZ family protein
MDVLDWGADISGAVFGAFIFVVFIKGRKRYSNATTELRAMEERDVRGFGLVLAMVFFMVLISVNLFKYRYGFLSHYTNFTFMITLVEFGLLGLLTIRFFYLRRDRQYFHVRDWLMLVLTGSIFLVVYQFTLIILQKRRINVAETMWSLICFVSGGVFYYLDKQIDRFRKKILQDPVYKRKTWQRVYFFFPPVVVLFLISFLSTRSPANLYQTHLPLPSDLVPKEGPLAIFQDLFFLHGLQFFIFGAFFFRAITWESWWHPQARRKWIWFGAYGFLIFYAFFDEFFFQLLTPGRMPDPYDSLTDILGGTVAMIAYLFGYRLLKEKYFNDPIPK